MRGADIMFYSHAETKSLQDKYATVSEALQSSKSECSDLQKQVEEYKQKVSKVFGDLLCNGTILTFLVLPHTHNSNAVIRWKRK